MGEAVAFSLTPADALLINVASVYAVTRVIDQPQRRDQLAAIAHVLPRASRDHVRMRDLVVACGAVVAAGLPGSDVDRHRAEFDLSIALAEVLRWRAVELMRRIEQQAEVTP